MAAFIGAKDQTRLFMQTREKVRRQWGGAFEMLGERLQRALLAEGILVMAALQDDSIGDDVIRRLVFDGLDWIDAQYDAD